jgi:hypothetical protein
MGGARACAGPEEDPRTVADDAPDQRPDQMDVVGELLRGGKRGALRGGPAAGRCPCVRAADGSARHRLDTGTIASCMARRTDKHLLIRTSARSRLASVMSQAG